MVPNTPEGLARYFDGWEACTRTGKYAGMVALPKNPHRIGTSDWADWFVGFGDALLLQLADIRNGAMVCTPYKSGA